MGIDSLTRSTVVGKDGKDIDDPERTSYGTFLVSLAFPVAEFWAD
jgi:hypothetical protein